MRRKKLIINMIIMTASTIIFGLISMVFRVYLSQKIGKEGMGLYQLIMSVYYMCVTLSSAGIRIAITRLVAEQIGRGNQGKVKSIVHKGCIYSLFFSLTASVILFNYADDISINFLKDPRAINSLKILSYGLPFIGVSSCLNGYFYGAREVVKSDSAEIIEQFVMMGIVVTAVNLFAGTSIEKVCALISVGFALGNIVSTVYAYFLCSLNTQPLNRNVVCLKQNKCKIMDKTKIA